MTDAERAAIYLTGAVIDVREEPTEPAKRSRRRGKKPKTEKAEPVIDLTAGGIIDST